MQNPILTKNFLAGVAIAPYRIVLLGDVDDGVVQAEGSSEALLGVSDDLGADAGDRVDVYLSGVTQVEYGGAVARSDWLTSDADGKAVVPAPAAGTNANIIGQAMVAGAAGDIGSVLISQGRIQG